MSHEGRMARGEENFNEGFLDNEDTRYFLENKEEVKPVKEVKEKKKKNGK